MSIMDDTIKKSSLNGFKITERKKVTNKISNFFYELSKTEEKEKTALQKRSLRLRYCGERKHILTIDNISHNLYSHKCRDRQCVDCQAIKSFVWQKKISEVNERLKAKIKAEDYTFLFLTFTIKNPLVTDLKATLKLMNKAIYQLFKHKKYIVGGIRTTEVTRGKSDINECHPHFHLLLIVKKNFLENKEIVIKNGKHTIPEIEKEFSQNFGKYLDMYAEDYGLKYNYEDYKNTPYKAPIVEVCRAVGEDKKTYINLDNAVENGGQIFGYILKYTVKGNGKEDDILFKKDRWFLEYDKQIKNIRLITPVGIYREELAELDKNKDYDFNEELKNISEKIKDKKIECDIYDYKNKDYFKVKSDFTVNEKIENAVLEKTYNQFKRAYSNLTDLFLNQSISNENFKRKDLIGNRERIEKIFYFCDLLVKKGFFIKQENIYIDKKSGEILDIERFKEYENTLKINEILKEDLENEKIDYIENIEDMFK